MRFDLPSALDRGYALTVNPIGDQICVSALQPAGVAQDDALYLLAHTRGTVHFVEPWDHESNLLVISKDALPSGVLYLVLFAGGNNPISERLVFVNNRDDRSEVSDQPDQDSYARRSLVKNRVSIADSDGEPSTDNFSVSVTSDRQLPTVSTSKYPYPTAAIVRSAWRHRKSGVLFPALNRFGRCT